MDDKEKAALRKVTDTRPTDFLQDTKEYDGREAKKEYQRRITAQVNPSLRVVINAEKQAHIS